MVNFKKETEFWIKGRCYVYRKHGGTILKAHAVWNKHYPDDPMVDGELIHHKDKDKTNDSLDNLEKMTFKVHGEIHSDIGTRNLAKWEKENPEKAQEVRKQNAKKLHDRINNDPVLKRKVANNKAKALSIPV